jgi:(2Fe-2S) ferredoxin
MSDVKQQLHAAAEKLGIGHYERHVFLCTGPNCCTPEVGMEAWDALKKELKEKGLLAGPHACYRTKVGCLRICTEGPTMVVYPEGTWYHGMTADKIDRFVREHLQEGRAVEEWVFARNALRGDDREVADALPRTACP